MAEKPAAGSPTLTRTRSLADLAMANAAVAAAEQTTAAPPEPVKDEFGRSYATGKRKNAVARVWLKAGTGKIKIGRAHV